MAIRQFVLLLLLFPLRSCRLQYPYPVPQGHPSGPSQTILIINLSPGDRVFLMLRTQPLIEDVRSVKSPG